MRVPHTDTGVVDRVRGVEMDIDIKSQAATSGDARVDGRTDVS